VLDPEVVVIGGGASRAGELLLEPTRESMADSLEGAEFRSLPPVVVAGLGEDAGLIGAALAAAENAHG
jgi:glucokinase